MPFNDIRISHIETFFIPLTKACHYEVPKQESCALYVPETSPIEICVNGEGFVRANMGDLIGVPRGTAHTLRLPGEPRQGKVPVCSPACASFTQRGAQELVFAAWHPISANPIPDLVPELIRIEAGYIEQHPPLKSTVRTVRELARSRTEAGDAAYMRLAEALALIIIEHVMSQHADTGINSRGAIHDDRLRKAISAMHEHPSTAWTLDSLAREVGLSRSVFVENFRRSTGQTPYQYLTQLRINIARSLLKERNLSISQIAWMVGYQSDAAFIKAFRRVVGVSPGAFRKTRSTEL